MKTDRLGQKISAIELLNEMKAIVREDMCWHHVFADQLAEAIAHAMRRRLGGREIYIPVPNKAARDERVRAEFNGRNLDEVCAGHGISKSRLYEIVKVKATEE